MSHSTYEDLWDDLTEWYETKPDESPSTILDKYPEDIITEMLPIEILLPGPIPEWEEWLTHALCDYLDEHYPI